MRESTESPSWAVARVLNVIAFGRLVNLRVKLLLCSGVTILKFKQFNQFVYMCKFTKMIIIWHYQVYF